MAMVDEYVYNISSHYLQKWLSYNIKHVKSRHLNMFGIKVSHQGEHNLDHLLSRTGAIASRATLLGALSVLFYGALTVHLQPSAKDRTRFWTRKMRWIDCYICIMYVTKSCACFSSLVAFIGNLRIFTDALKLFLRMDSVENILRMPAVLFLCPCST